MFNLKTSKNQFIIYVYSKGRSIQARIVYYNLGCPPCPGTVTTRIIPFLVGNPYKPSFVTVTGRGDNPNYAAYAVPYCPYHLL